MASIKSLDSEIPLAGSAIGINCLFSLRYTSFSYKPRANASLICFVLLHPSIDENMGGKSLITLAEGLVVTYCYIDKNTHSRMNKKIGI